MTLLAIAHVTVERGIIWKYQQEEKSNKLNKQRKTTTKLPPKPSCLLQSLLEWPFWKKIHRKTLLEKWTCTHQILCFCASVNEGSAVSEFYLQWPALLQNKLSTPLETTMLCYVSYSTSATAKSNSPGPRNSIIHPQLASDCKLLTLLCVPTFDSLREPNAKLIA